MSTVNDTTRPDRCETCRFWQASSDDDSLSLGSCHRFPPTANYTYGLILALAEIGGNPQAFDPARHSFHETFAIFPNTESGEWCGLYEPTGGPKMSTDRWPLPTKTCGEHEPIPEAPK